MKRPPTIERLNERGLNKRDEFHIDAPPQTDYLATMSFGLAPPKELTSQEAADFIAKIAVKHGYIEPATLEAMPAHVRMLVEEALKKDSKGNAAVNELAILHDSG